ncbi:MAG: prolyl oligopeptidase family serine peptidase [Zavarzinella sp.]
MIRFLIVLCLCGLGTHVGYTQGSKADYQRAEDIRKLGFGNVFRDRMEPKWFDNNRKFWYSVSTAPGMKEYVVVDAHQGTRKLAFSHKDVGAALAGESKRQINPNQLEITWLETTDSGVKFVGYGATWQWVENEKKLTKLAPQKPAEQPNSTTMSQSRFRGGRPSRRSPDNNWELSSKEHNLVLNSKGKDTPLTKDGAERNRYESSGYWSPDSRFVVVMRYKPGTERIVYMVESSPKDQVQPKLQTMRYQKPGDEIDTRQPYLVDVVNAKIIPLDRKLFDNPWSIGEIRWQQDSGSFTFYYNQRGHQVSRIIEVEAATGKARAVIDESVPTFHDYTNKQFSWFINDDQMIWMSERSGWNHLYLIDVNSGKVVHPITQGEWLVRGIDRIDNEKKLIWFRAMGMDPKQDPYHVHYCRVNFDGTNLVRLTEGDGTHSVRYSPDEEFLIDSWSRVDLAPQTELRDAQTGKKILTLEVGDQTRLLKQLPYPPERFQAKGRDGKTDIYGVIFRPSNFDPTKKYPVIEDIYAGPHDHFVPKSYRALFSQQSLAELGFIVVKIDGMGTNWRSKAFHDVCWQNLGDSGFLDRIAWMKAAAAKYPAFDLSRVGIFGGSAGGQSSTRAMLAYGDFYHVAVSDCGCHDNRMDKVWWNEQWMGYPVGKHYEEQSNVTQAHRLKGKLLLMVGELDRNVDPASTMQVVNALIKANKDFDMLVIPGGGHGSGAYGNRRRTDYFVRHLLNKEPRWE